MRVDLVGRDHIEQCFGRLEPGLRRSNGLLGPERHFFLGRTRAPGTPHDAAATEERHHPVLPTDMARRLAGGAGRQGPGEGFGKATEGFLVRDWQVLEVFGQEERPALDHQDPRLRFAVENAFGERQRTETGADDDEIELLFFTDLLPLAFREKEHVVEHFLCGGRLWSGSRVAVTEVG
ncbi:hypothetical protein D3C77_560950 [compost metagenome]